MKTVPNNQAADYVRNKVTFNNRSRDPSLYGRWFVYDEDSNRAPMYVVYSYGPHWPLYIWDERTAQWLGNKDKVSVTTTRHAAQTRPPDDIKYYSCDAMLEIAKIGLRKYMAKELTK